MKLSVMLFPYFGKLCKGEITPAELVKTFASWGVRGLEPMLSQDEKEPKIAAEIQAAMADFGMVNTCLDRGVNLIGTCEADRVAALDSAKRALDLARDVLKCKRVMLHGTKPAEGMSTEDGLKIYGEMLRKAGEYSKGSGVKFCIENFGMYPTFAASSKNCKIVLDYAEPEVGFTFDNGNFLLGDDTPEHAFEVMQDKICHVHLKDFAVRKEGQTGGIASASGVYYVDCPMGAGVGEIANCVKLLKAAGYQDWMSLEVGMEPISNGKVGADLVLAAWG